MEQNNPQGINWNEQLYNIVRDVFRHWHTICLFAVIVAIAGDMFLTLTYEPVYRTDISVVRKQLYSESKGQGEENEIAEALKYILSSNVFMDKVKEDLGVQKLKGTYEIEVTPGTNVMKIIAEAETPQFSYRMLLYVLENYEEVVNLVLGDTELRVIDNIHINTVPYNQLNHFRNYMIYGGAGLLFMVMVYVAFSWLKNTIKEERDVKNKLQIRLLTSIVKESKNVFRGGSFHRKKALLITQLSTSPEFLEAFRRLRIRFEAQAAKRGYKVVCVNSTMENEGKSSVVVNLAISLAQHGKKVLLMDLDMGKPAIYKLLEKEPEHGVEEALSGEIQMKEAVFYHERYKMDCIFVKQAVKKRTQMLESEILKNWILEQKENYDYILIDTPPAHIMSDSKIIAQYADAVLLVVCQNVVPTALINRTIDHYLMQDTPVMGCVLNRTMPFGISGRKTYQERGGKKYAES